MSQPFRKKKVAVEAVQWTGENREEVDALVGRAFDPQYLVGAPGDWIVMDPESGLSACSPTDFKATYEPASAPEPQGVVLDSETRERLESIAADYEGTGVMDSSDVAFLRSLASHQPDRGSDEASAIDLGLEHHGEGDDPLVTMLGVWADWIASGRGMEDTNRQLCAEDLNRAARRLIQPDSQEAREERLMKGAIAAHDALQPDPEQRYTVEEIREALNTSLLAKNLMTVELSDAIYDFFAAFNKATDHREEGGG